MLSEKNIYLQQKKINLSTSLSISGVVCLAVLRGFLQMLSLSMCVWDDRRQAAGRARGFSELSSLMRKLERCSDLWLACVFLLSQVYLCLPNSVSLTEGHCLIVPIQHHTAATGLDEDIWSEIQVQSLQTGVFLYTRSGSVHGEFSTGKHHSEIVSFIFEYIYNTDMFCLRPKHAQISTSISHISESITLYNILTRISRSLLRKEMLTTTSRLKQISV